MSHEIYYTLEDPEGILRPMAGIWTGDGEMGEYYKIEADKKAKKTNLKVVKVKLLILKELNL